MSEPAPEFCPYVGLRPFTVEEQAFFFGRRSETRIIAANLFAAPLTVFYGSSAVGKSSVLQAGVIPELRHERKTAVLYFRQWQTDDYLSRLKAESRAAIERAGDGKRLEIDDGLPFDRWIEQALEQFRGQLHVLLDQFEEYLLYHADPGPSSFDAELAAAINRRTVGARFLIALRDDGLAKLDRFRKRIPNLLGNTLRLQRLSVSSAHEAIQGPLRVYNERLGPGQPAVTIEDALVEGVLAQVRADQVSTGAAVGQGQVQSATAADEIETAYLQLVMERLWRERATVNSHQELRRETLDRLGGAKAIAKQHFDEHLDRLAKTGSDVGDMVVDLFAYLVTPTGTKISQKEDDLVALTQTPAARVRWFLGELVASRLLRVTDPPERYEIFHDALAKPFLDSRNAIVMKRATEAKEEELKQVQAIADAQRLRAEAESQRVTEQKAAARKFKLLAGGMAVLAVLAGAAGVFAYFQARRAEQLQQLAEARQVQVEEVRKETSDLSRKQQDRIDELIGQLAKNESLSAAEQKRLIAESQAAKDRLNSLNTSANSYAAQVSVPNPKDITDLRDQLTKAQQQIANLERQLKAAQVEIGSLTTQRDTAQNEAKQRDDEVRQARADVNRLNAENARLRSEPKPDSKVVDPKLPADPKGADLSKELSGDYRSIYQNAMNAYDRQQWESARRLFAAAAVMRADSKETIPMSSGRIPYLPYVYLGLTYRQLGRCDEALPLWAQAEKLGAVTGSAREYKLLLQGRETCQPK
ncbi:MAG: hypothetical protein ACRD2N_05630 [Vicinamibacterales bacterium]